MRYGSNRPGTVSNDGSSVKGALKAPTPSNTDIPEVEATREMCHHCFDSLIQELRRLAMTHGNRSVDHYLHYLYTSYVSVRKSDNCDAIPTTDPSSSFLATLPHESIQCPLFVTWEKRKGHATDNDSDTTTCNKNTKNHELRGCIGSLTPKPLHTAIADYAIISAFQDKRFRPIVVEELPQLRVAVSLLVLYEECSDCFDWQVGVHGIIIKFCYDHHPGGDIRTGTTTRSRGVEASATFLPEVAAQQGWDQHQTVQALIRKAGYEGPVTEQFFQKIRCTRYQSSKYRVSFDEYIRYTKDTINPNSWITLVESTSDTDMKSSVQSNCQLM